MDKLLDFFEQVNKGDMTINVYYSSILDWKVDIGYKFTHPKHGDIIVSVQHCDKDYVAAKAQYLFKEWLLNNEGGY